MKVLNLPFEERRIPLYGPASKEEILKHSPAGKVPCLIDGASTVWDSLAIIEYIAETYPVFPIWPRGTEARAYARSLSAEMHSGFMALRNECPMNIRRPRRAIKVSEEALADVKRIDEAFVDARARFGGRSPSVWNSPAGRWFICLAVCASARKTRKIPITDFPRARGPSSFVADSQPQSLVRPRTRFSSHDETHDEITSGRWHVARSRPPAKAAETPSVALG